MESNLETDFLDVPLQRKSMHLYCVRSAILGKLRAAIPHFRGKLLDVGCGHMPYKTMLLSSNAAISEYIGMDLADNRSYANQPDLSWDGVVIPLPDSSVDSAMATEVLEHCPYPERTLKEIHRVLKPGGILFITVPFIWMLHEAPYDEYRYTPFALKRLVESSNFKIVELNALGGWNASLAQFVANWLYYSEENRRLRKIGKILFFPVFKFLIKRDKVPTKFETGQMINGLSCLAQKEDLR
jgi:SAM-dependent methyltransferase